MHRPLLEIWYSKIHPVSYANTHHDFTDLVNHGMVKNTKTWIPWEWNISFLWNKKMLNLCHKCHILISYHFVPEVTFKNNQTVVVSPLTKLTVLVATLHKFSSLFSSLNTMLFTTRRRRTKAFVLFRFLKKKKKKHFPIEIFHPPLFSPPSFSVPFL